MSIITALSDYKIIFFDFDGVIKESVEVKTNAFRELFRSFGEEVMDKVTNHHMNNGGMSRFKKIPIYLSYAGIKPNQDIENEFCIRFAKIVEDKVVSSDWVPGVKNFIENKRLNQHFVLITATPEDEIKRILIRLNVINIFSDIFGSPMSKSEAINNCLKYYNVKPLETIMIGDSKADYEAAEKSGTNFLLRRTSENLISMSNFNGNYINNFLNDEK